MKKEFRVLKNSDFQKIIKNNQKFHSKNFVIYYQKSLTISHRIGITISKKVSKKAVDRNLLKRRINHILCNYDNFLLLLDYILIAKSAASTLDYSSIEEEIIFLLKKVYRKNQTDKNV